MPVRVVIGPGTLYSLLESFLSEGFIRETKSKFPVILRLPLQAADLPGQALPALGGDEVAPLAALHLGLPDEALAEEALQEAVEGPVLVRLTCGGHARICSVGCRLLDGTEFIGTGIQPDILLEPDLPALEQGGGWCGTWR